MVVRYSICSKQAVTQVPPHTHTRTHAADKSCDAQRTSKVPPVAKKEKRKQTVGRKREARKLRRCTHLSNAIRGHELWSILRSWRPAPGHPGQERMIVRVKSPSYMPKHTHPKQ